MQRPIPLFTLLRFPVIFGTFLIAGGTGFYYREFFMGDLEEKRMALTRENVADKKTIEDKIREMRK